MMIFSPVKNGMKKLSIMPEYGLGCEQTRLWGRVFNTRQAVDDHDQGEGLFGTARNDTVDL